MTHAPEPAARTRLPNRRPQISEAVDWHGHRWLLGIGFDDEGRVREVFMDGVKVGQELEGLLDDACILVSVLLQMNVAASRIAEHLGRESVDPHAPAASPIGMVAKRIAAVEEAEGPAMRELAAAMRGRRG